MTKIGTLLIACSAFALIASNSAAQSPPPLPGSEPAVAEAEFYIDSSGTAEGPLTLEELFNSVRNAEVTPDTLAWTDGQAGWLPAGQMEALAALFMQPPPLPQSRPGPPPLPSVQYFVEIDGAQAGPFGAQALAERVAAGDLTPTTQVWTEGMAGWTAAGEITALASLFEAGPAAGPPPIPEATPPAGPPPIPDVTGPPPVPETTPPRANDDFPPPGGGGTAGTQDFPPPANSDTGATPPPPAGGDEGFPEPGGQAGGGGGGGGAIPPPPPPRSQDDTGQTPPPPGAASDPRFDQLAQTERADMGVPATAELKSGAMHGATPNSIPGGQLITTKGLVELLGSGIEVRIFDVLGGPQALPGALGAVAAAEGGSFSDQMQQTFAQFLGEVTGNRKEVPLVFYCLSRECWMSYNASLRAINMGYTNVLWYRGGIEAWQSMDLQTAPLAQ